MQWLVKVDAFLTAAKSPTLTDHILTSCSEKVVQAGIIEHHYLTINLSFAPEQYKRAKLNKHNYLTFRSMKNFSTEIYEETLGKLTFSDYETFICVNEAYSDLSSTYKNY